MRRSFIGALCAAVVLVFSVPAAFAASAEVEELKAQVRMLQQRLDQMEQREKERAAEPARAPRLLRRGDGHDGRRARRDG